VVQELQIGGTGTGVDPPRATAEPAPGQVSGATPTLAAPAPSTGRLTGIYVVYAGVFCMFWSSSFPVTKIALIDSPPLVLLTARFAVAAVVLFAVGLATEPLPRLSARDYAALIVTGFIMHAVHLGFGYYGVSLVSAGFAAMLFSTSPILAAVLAAIFLGERLTRAKALGFALGFVGVAIVLSSRLGGGIENPIGAVFVFCAALALVCGTILYKKLMPGGGLWFGQAIQFVAAALGVLPVMLLVDDIATVTPTPSLFVAFSYIVLITAIGSYSLWLFLVMRTSASAASSLLFLTPPLGLFFGWLVLGEPVFVADLIGVVPIAVGIRLVTRG
jgi:drug/metabolite transporter (DMT)-like permease